MTEKLLQKTSRKLKAGIILTVIFSILIGFLNVGVLYLFGIPFLGLFLGITLIWLSEAEKKLKILWTISPFLIIPATFFMFLQINKAEPETFLIPQNFRGKIVIFYEESCGQKPVYENGRRIYRFPESGILITNYKKTKGILDQEFYFVDEYGKRIKIAQKDVRDFNGAFSKPKNNTSRKEVGAFYSYAGIFPSKVMGKYHSHIISAYKDFEKDEKESWRELKQFSEQSEKLLKQCREQISQ